MWGPLITAMVTPFDDEGRLDLDAAAGLADHLVATGSTGVLVCGTTGESPTLAHDEKISLIQTVKDAVGRRAAVLAGTGNNNTAATVEFTREASELGIDGVMLVCPYYNKPSQEGLFQHFAAAARATSLPVMIYNIEGRTSRNILPSTIGRLAREVKNVVALKEASGNIGQIAQMKLATPNGFHLYSGNDGDTPAVLCAGGVGVVSVASHLVGQPIRDMIAAFLGGDFAAGVATYLRLQPLVEALFPATSTSPAPVKEALALIGHPVGGVRLPLVGCTDEDRRRLIDVLGQLGLR